MRGRNFEYLKSDNNPNKLKRILISLISTVWFSAYIFSQQRDYQDRWILEDIFWPFILFIVLFLLVIKDENDNKVIAFICSITVVAITAIPSLKYYQPYGISVDATSHLLMTESLITKGQVLKNDVYATIPGMHVWLASFAILGDIPTEGIIRFGLPLTAGFMPLLLYFLARKVNIPSELIKYILASTCLSIYPYHLPTGTGFSIIPLTLIFGTLVLREYYSKTTQQKFQYSIILILGLAQITIWHSTSPIFLPFSLTFIYFCTLIFPIILRQRHNQSNFTYLRVSMLAVILFLSYRIVLADRIFEIMTNNIYQMITTQESMGSVVPERVFELNTIEFLKLVIVLHGRDIVLILFFVVSIFILWKKRAEWDHTLTFYFYWIFIGISFVLLIPVSVSGIGYRRLTWYPLAISPLFVGIVLWWLRRKISTQALTRAWVGNLIWSGLLLLILSLSVSQFFIYQPLIPKAGSINPELSEEYVVWLSSVNSAYQERMLTFAEKYTPPRIPFAIDFSGRNQFIRYFGNDAAYQRGMWLFLHWQIPVDTSKAKLFLLHWPGPAGGFGEQVEYRSVSKINKLRNTPGWGLIYDNGESFILLLND